MSLKRTEEDESFAKLEALALRPKAEIAPDAPRILFISLYCFKSFPVRGFHALARQAGIHSDALFLKNNFTNRHLPISETEIALLQQVVRDTKPDVIAISVLTPYVPAARRACAAIRAVTDVPVVTGGKHATISPDEALTYADYACQGEGELVLLEMFERMAQRRRDFDGIRGLWHRDAAGAVVDMGQRRLLQDLDKLPFEAYGEPNMWFIEHDRLDTQDPELDEDEILVMAGRGCVYKCSYCVNSLLIPQNRNNGRFIRVRSPDQVIAQIEDRVARHRHATKVSFNDEVFGVFDDWTAEFAAKYTGRGLPPFNSELVPKLIKEANMRLLAAAGLFEMHFGIQSGSDTIRNDVLDRPGKNPELIEKAYMLAGLGIQVQCDLILGNPFDTPEVLAETIELLAAMPQPLKLNTYKLQYFPHYPLTLRAIEAGFLKPEDVTEDVIAENTLYNFVYTPVIDRFDRKTVLENCVYLIPWNTALVWWVVTNLARRHNPALAVLANVLAAWRYQLDFRGNPALVWLRRFWLVGRMVMRGEIGGLARRVAARLLPGRAG
ncbi:MAG: cobalamin B12-binding domain-containing protein [Rhodospirillaceae bacterium]|nr:cobalamin B12-binding domain-containing protein [Rhodospirillales bacterium]